MYYVFFVCLCVCSGVCVTSTDILALDHIFDGFDVNGITGDHKHGLISHMQHFEAGAHGSLWLWILHS